MGFDDRRETGKPPGRIAVQPAPDRGVGKNQRLIVDVSHGGQAISGQRWRRQDRRWRQRRPARRPGRTSRRWALTSNADERKQVRRAVGDLHQRRAVGQADIDIRSRWNRDSHSHAQGPSILLQENRLDNDLHVAELPGRAETRAIGDNVVGFQDAHGKPHFHRHASIEESLLEARARSDWRPSAMPSPRRGSSCSRRTRGPWARCSRCPQASALRGAGAGTGNLEIDWDPDVVSLRIMTGRSGRPPYRRSCWEHSW